MGGAGVILRFERIRPRRSGRFQPLRAGEITPAFLERTIGALKRWKYEFVTMDEVCRRAAILAQPRRFVCLTFDGGYKDVIHGAYPTLSRHGVPFTVYVPTAFPDGVGEAWWLAIERRERRFAVRTVAEKNEAYAFLASWLRRLPPADLSAAINDLCRRYSV